jgi:PAS domain S-box-containing protein
VVTIKKDHLVQALNNIGKAILFENSQREIVFANQVFCDLFNIENSPKSLIGTSSIFLDKRIADMVVEQLDFAINLSHINENVLLNVTDQIHLSNGKVLMREYFPMLENDQLAGKLWLYSEYKFQRNYEKTIELFESIDLMIIAVDQNNLIQYVNNKWADFFGISKDAFIGKDFLHYFHYDSLYNSDHFDHSIIFSNFEKKLNRSIVSLKDHNGEIKKFRYYTKKIPSYLDGSDLDYIYFNNITLDMQIQEDLVQSNLKEKELQQQKSNLVSMVSHDLRTSLSIILLKAEILEMTLLKKKVLKKDEANLPIEKIIKQVDNMTEMISNYLFLHKIETVSFEPLYQETNIEESVKDIFNEFYNPWKDGRKLKLIISGNIRKRKVDKAMLKTVIINLLENAFKYSLSSNRSPILRVKGYKNYWTISVVDFGIGIPRLDINIIFKVFSRGSNSRNFVGNGVGLMIVKKLADNIGATIMVRSVQNNYTIFYLKILNI